MAAPEFSSNTSLKKRQLLIFVGLGALGVVVLVSFLYKHAVNQAIQPQRRADRVVKQEFDTPRQVVDPKDAWITSSEVSLETMSQQLEAFREQNERLQRRLEQIESGDPSGAPDGEPLSRRTLLPPLGKPPPPAKTIPKPDTVARSPVAKGLASLEPPEPKIVRVAFAQVSDSRGELNRPHINDTLPAGSFVNAVLLNGLAAPTGNLGQRNPHPILLELVDFGNLPNRFSHRVKNCRIIAAGHGELSDERAYFRLERLSCVLRTGEVVSKEAAGYVTGEDGKNGLAGDLITKQGAFVARALLAGVFSGLGRAIGQSYTNVSTSALGTVETIDPNDILRAGGAEGVSNAAEKVADWYLQRADEVFPFVEIEAGRIVTVTFTSDIALEANVIEKYVQ